MSKYFFFLLFFFLTQALSAQRFTLRDLDVDLQGLFNSQVRLLSANGDFNGDGFGDICMQESADTFVLILGGSLPRSGDLSSIPRTSIRLPIPNYGYSTRPFFADINGDGKDDLFVHSNDSLSGLAYVYSYVIFGSSSPPQDINLNNPSETDLVIETSHYGTRGLVLTKGDFDGDGKEDVLFPGSLPVSPFAHCDLLLGSSIEGKHDIDLDDGVSAIRFQGTASSDFGFPSTMGDLNGDGLADLVISEKSAGPVGRTNAGRVYIFSGTTVPFSPSSMLWDVTVNPADVTLTGDRQDGQLRCHAVGDYLDDGSADVVMESYQPNELVLWDGAALMGAGATVDLAVWNQTHTPLWTWESFLPSVFSLFPAFGDFDGEGRKDFFMLEGGALVRGGLSTTPLKEGSPPVFSTGIEYAPANALDLGDINGDGKTDLVVLGLDGSLGILYGYRPLDSPSIQVRAGSVAPKLILDFSVQGDPTEMKVSGDFGDSINGQWVPFRSSLPITLTQTEEQKNLSVVFRNLFGRESLEVQTSFNLTSGTPGLVVVDNVIDAQTATARMDCHVDSATHVKATIHDQSGAVISGILDADLPSGVWPLEWDGKNESGLSVGPGLYYMAIERNGSSEKEKILVKR